MEQFSVPYSVTFNMPELEWKLDSISILLFWWWLYNENKISYWEVQGWEMRGDGRHVWLIEPN